MSEELELLLKNYPAEIHKALLIRRTEEKLLSLYAEGKLNGTVHTCVGQEFSGVFIAKHLDTNDFVVSNHRGHGHYIARTGDVPGLIAEVMGKVNGSCSGVGGSQHLVHENYLSNGIQGGMTPVATGVALASKLKGLETISVAYIGDGTMGEGILYESLNIAALWETPVLFVCENNSYAQSTHFKQAFSGSIEKRIEGFDVTYFTADTWNPEVLDSQAKAAVEYVRSTGKPAFFEIKTYRLNSHSKGDDNRHKHEIENYKGKDVLSALLASEHDTVQTMLQQIDAEIAAATEEAESAALLDTYPNGEFHEWKPVKYTAGSGKGGRINDLIYDALKARFEKDETAILIGEDIEWLTDWTGANYGGAFKVSKDLSHLFKGRVKNTPISEGAITGVGTGLALAGFRPIVEIMFGDFMTLTFDQLFQHAAKFIRMFGGKVDVPLIIRTPMGGKRGYGPTHSQSIEKFFLGIPDLQIVALNNRIDPGVLYNAIFEGRKVPTIVVENKILYTRYLNEQEIAGFNIEMSDEAFPTVRISPAGSAPNVTVVCYGGMLEDVERAIQTAFDEEEILCEVICPSAISPLNLLPIAESVKKTGRLVIVEEGPGIAALGSEIAAGLMERGVSVKSLKRMANNSIIPCSLPAETALLPNKMSIFLTIKQCMNG